MRRVSAKNGELNMYSYLDVSVWVSQNSSMT